MDREGLYSPEEVHLLAAVATERRRGERDALLIEVIFSGLTSKQALSLQPSNICRLPNGGATFDIENKPGRLKVISCSPELACSLESYAKRRRLLPTDKFFPITRTQLWYIINVSGKKAKLGNVTPSLIRQSGNRCRHRGFQDSQGVEESLCETCNYRLCWKKYRCKEN